MTTAATATQPTSPTETWHTNKQITQKFGISRWTLAIWRKKGLNSIGAGKYLRYREQDVIDFLNSRKG